LTVVLDTCALIEIGHGHPKVVRLLADADQLLIPTVVIGEFLAGTDDTKRGRHMSNWLHDFLNHVIIAPIALSTAGHFASLYCGLRRSGKMIPQNDLWIAAVALEYDAPLATDDQHLLNVRGLTCISW